MKLLKPLAILCAVAFFGHFWWQHRAVLNPESVRSWISQFGIMGPFMYASMYALNTVFLFPPLSLLGPVAGLAFGPVVGFFAIMGGAMIGTTLTFYISRTMGRRLAQKLLRGKLKLLDEKLERRGFVTVLFLRIVFFPYEVLNYACGLSKMKFRDYFLATLLGLIPGTVVAVFLGHSFTQIRSNPKALIIVAVMSAIVVILCALFMKFRRKGRLPAGSVLRYNK